jgi:putative SOS response-associated peptidase YedK
MCGRYVIAKERDELSEFYQASFPLDFETVSYNIAPTNLVPIVVEREVDSVPTREIHPARFGLIPSWAREIGTTPLFNARIETVLEKPSFRESALKKRCVIPASGYFEWDREKNPLFVQADPFISFAGIYSFWRDPYKAASDPSRWLLSCSILTKTASPALSEIHDRSPVFLSEDGIEAWISPDYETTEELLMVLGQESDFVAEEMRYHKVSKEVGNVRNNHPGLITEIAF